MFTYPFCKRYPFHRCPALNWPFIVPKARPIPNCPIRRLDGLGKATLHGLDRPKNWPRPAEKLTDMGGLILYCFFLSTGYLKFPPSASTPFFITSFKIGQKGNNCFRTLNLKQIYFVPAFPPNYLCTQIPKKISFLFFFSFLASIPQIIVDVRKKTYL